MHQSPPDHRPDPVVRRQLTVDAPQGPVAVSRSAVQTAVRYHRSSVLVVAPRSVRRG